MCSASHQQSDEGKSGGWGDLMNSAAWYAIWIQEAKRLTANEQGAMWVFNSWRSFPVLARAAYEARWGIESLMVWDKEWIGPGGQRGLRPSYEPAALFCHSEFELANRGLPDIWRSKWSSQKPHGHSAEKPESLIKRMIQESGGGLVLDPFMGSGTTLASAKSAGTNAIGIEIEERWCEVAAKRLEQGVLFGATA
jgi:DNA modification methylase